MGPLRVKRSGAPAPAHLVKTERRSRSRSFGETGAALPLPLIWWKGSGAPAPAHSVKRERRSRSFGEKGAALPLLSKWARSFLRSFTKNTFYSSNILFLRYHGQCWVVTNDNDILKDLKSPSINFLIKWLINWRLDCIHKLSFHFQFSKQHQLFKKSDTY